MWPRARAYRLWESGQLSFRLHLGRGAFRRSRGRTWFAPRVEVNESQNSSPHTSHAATPAARHPQRATPPRAAASPGRQTRARAGRAAVSSCHYPRPSIPPASSRVAAASSCRHRHRRRHHHHHRAARRRRRRRPRAADRGGRSRRRSGPTPLRTSAHRRRPIRGVPQPACPCQNSTPAGPALAAPPAAAVAAARASPGPARSGGAPPQSARPVGLAWNQTRRALCRTEGRRDGGPRRGRRPGPERRPTAARLARCLAAVMGRRSK